MRRIRLALKPDEAKTYNAKVFDDNIEVQDDQITGEQLGRFMKSKLDEDELPKLRKLIAVFKCTAINILEKDIEV